MENRRLTPSIPEFGLLAWLENTRVSLPLKGVECRFDVTGTVASVELDQIYHQDAAQPLDCTYTFPLPAGAAVYRCEVHINGRIIRARVEEQGKARRIFAEQKAAGHRAALVESERENVFTLSLGNIQPEDLIVVRFAWFQVLDTATDGLRLLVPTCPGIRYIPGQPLLRASSGTGTTADTDQVPDASRISPPRIDRLHPDAAYFCIEGRLAAADVQPGSVSSPSHAIEVRARESTISTQLSGHSAVPDRDFVLTWREPQTATLQPRGWHWTDAGRGYSYALALLRGPENIPVAKDYAQDVYFLVDRSGSMQGLKWDRTCEALRAFVQQLGPQDRVWITLFESSYRDFSDRPMLAAEVLKDHGFQRMQRMGVAGGTELLPAALHVLTKIAEFSAERPPTVVLITDGQMGNEQMIMQAFRKSTATTVHTFGIDTAVNDAFLRSLARQQRGCCWLQTPNDDIAGTIAGLGARLRRPVLNKMQVEAPWEAADQHLPNLRGGEVALIPLRMKAATPPIVIATELPDGTRNDIRIDCTAGGGEALKLLWARDRIATLLAAKQATGAIALATEFNIICEGAAFIAWDEAEQVQVAERSVIQPAMVSEMLYDKMDCHVAAAPRVSKEAISGGWDSRSELILRASRSRGPRGGGGPSSAPLGEPPQFRASRSGANFMQRLVHLAGLLPQWVHFQNWIGNLIQSVRFQEGASPEEIEKLITAAELVAKLKDGRYSRYHRFHQLLQSVLDAAPQSSVHDQLIFGDAAQDLFPPLDALIRQLADAKLPVDLIDYLLMWLCPLGLPLAPRLSRLTAFLVTLAHGPFSENSTALRWKQFLAGTEGIAPQALECLDAKDVPVNP